MRAAIFRQPHEPLTIERAVTLVAGRRCYRYRAIDRDGALIGLDAPAGSATSRPRVDIRAVTLR